MSDLSDFFSQLIAGQLLGGLPQQEGIDPYQVIGGNAQIPPQMLAQALHLNLLNGTTPFSGGGQGQGYTDASGGDAGVIAVPPPQPIMTPGDLPTPPAGGKGGVTVGGVQYPSLKAWNQAMDKQAVEAQRGSLVNYGPSGPDPNAYYQEDTGRPMSPADISPGAPPIPPAAPGATPTMVQPLSGSSPPAGRGMPLPPSMSGGVDAALGGGRGFNANALMQLLAADMLRSRQTDIYDKMLEFGLATMAAAGKPMATTLGAVGEGGLAALKGGREREAASLKNLVSGAQIANVMGEADIRQGTLQAQRDYSEALKAQQAGTAGAALPEGQSAGGSAGGIPFGPGNPGSLAMAHSPEQQEAVAKTIATTSGLQHWGGVDPKTGEPWNPKLRAALGVAGLPLSGPVTPEQWEKAKPLILRFESMGGQNIPNYRFDATHTAGGPFQITNSTWQQFGGGTPTSSGQTGPAQPSPGAGGDTTATTPTGGTAIPPTPTGGVFTNDGVRINPFEARRLGSLAAAAGRTQDATYWLDMAKPPANFAWKRDGSVAPIKGGPADLQYKAAEKAIEETAKVAPGLALKGWSVDRDGNYKFIVGGEQDPKYKGQVAAAEAAARAEANLSEKGFSRNPDGSFSFNPDIVGQPAAATKAGELSVSEPSQMRVVTHTQGEMQKREIAVNSALQNAISQRERLAAAQAPIHVPSGQTVVLPSDSMAADNIRKVKNAGGFLPKGTAIRDDGSVQITGDPGAQLANDMAQAQGKKIIERQDAAMAARNEIIASQTAQQLLNHYVINAGTLGPLKQWFGAALQEAGYNYAKDAVANTDAFFSQRGYSVGNIAQMFGTSRSISDGDRIASEAIAGGKRDLTEQSIRQILAITEHHARLNLGVYNEQAKPFEQFSSVPLTITVPEVPPLRMGPGFGVTPSGGRTTTGVGVTPVR